MRFENECPQLAARDCQHCRKYFYDEKTGEPRKSRGKLLERIKPPPCETDDGCKKGHWKNQKKVHVRDYALLNLYEAARATGGANLNERERSDGLCMHLLAKVDQFYRNAEAAALRAQLTATLLTVASKPK